MIFFSGVGTALVTPRRDNGTVDIDAYLKNAQRQLTAGIDMLIPFGTTGEADYVDKKIQDKLIRQLRSIVDKLNREVPIIVGTGEKKWEDTVERTHQVIEAGANAALIKTPDYVKSQQTGLIHHFEKIAQNLPNVPIIIYNVPGRTGVNMEPTTFYEIAQALNVVAVKEASGNLIQIAEYIGIARELSTKVRDISILSGDDATTYHSIRLGADGVISVWSNLDPNGMLRMVHNELGGDYNIAWEDHHRLSSGFKASMRYGNPNSIKYMMEVAGLHAGPPDAELGLLTYSQKKDLEKVMEQYAA